MMQKPENPSCRIACLYEQYGRDVLGILLRLTNGNRSEAEDLTQETFLAAFRGHESFSGQVPVRAWLVGIAARRWRDSLRRPKLQTTALLDEPVTRATPETTITDRATLASALSQLPDEQQTAVLLVLAQGLTYREAADILNIPIGTLKWRVAEASKRLRILLSDDDE